MSVGFVVGFGTGSTNGRFGRRTRGPLAQRVVMMSQGRIEVIRSADEDTIEKHGCRLWPTWSCEASVFPWTYSVSFASHGEISENGDVSVFGDC